MLGGLLNSVSLRAARTALSGLSRRQEAIADNIANIDTPGYQRREVTFERALEASINRSSQHTSLVTTAPRRSSTGWRAAPMSPRRRTPRSRASRTPRRCG